MKHLFKRKPLAGTELRRRIALRQQREFDSVLHEMAVISKEYNDWRSAAYAIDKCGLDTRIARLPEKARKIAEQFKICLKARITARAVNQTDSDFQAARINMAEQRSRLDEISRFAGSVENNVRQQRLYSTFATGMIRKPEKV